MVRNHSKVNQHIEVNLNLDSTLKKRLFFCLVLVLFTSVAQAQQPRFGKLDSYYKSLVWNELGFFEFSFADANAYLVSDFYEPEKETADYTVLENQVAFDSTAADIFTDVFINNWPKSEYAVLAKLRLANDAFNQKNYKKAIQDYQEVLVLDNEKKVSDKVVYWMAESARLDKNTDQSRAYYLQLADDFPKSDLAPSALYARGAMYLSEKEYDKATEAFELLKKRYPNDKVTRRIGTALGEAYYQQRRFEECITALKNELPLLQGEEESKAVFLIAESYNYLNDFENASAFYLRYNNLNEGKDEARYAQYGLGWVYHKQQIYHWSAESFANAVKGDDDLSRKALYYKAVNEKMAGLYPKAMQTFQTFGQHFKTGFWVEEAYYEWAISAFEFNEFTETIEILLSVIRSDMELKQEGKLFSLLGEAYFANNEYTRAMQAFEEAEKSVDVDPDVKVQASFQKAWLLYRNQAYKQAQPLFEQIVKSHPNSKVAAEALFWSADSYYSYEDYGPAGAQFAQFVELYPTHKLVGAAKYSLGWCRFKMGEYRESVEPFENFLQNYQPPPIALFPYDIDTKLRLGDAHYALREYDTAIDYYQKTIGADPGGDYAIFQIANSYYRSDRTYEAVTNFRKMLRIYPFSRLREQAQYNIGYVYFLMGNYDQAIVEFNTVINKYPGTPWAARAQYNIGDAFYNAGKYNDAINAYKLVLQNHPKSDYILEAINGIQYAQLASGESDSSEQIFEEFIYANPSSKTADRLRYRQAETILQSGDYDGAVKSFTEYIRISNNKKLVPEARYSLAESYRLHGDVDKAISELESFIQDYPNLEKTPIAMSLLGRIRLEREEFDAAFEVFSQLDKDFIAYKAEALIGLGTTEIGRQKFENARTYFEKGAGLFPNNDAMKLGIAKVNYEELKDDVALPQLQEIAKKNTAAEGAEAQFMIGRIYQDKAMFNDALDAFSKVKILYEAYESWVSNALLESAVCYQKLGNPVESKKTLKLLIEKYPNTPAAKDAEEMIQ
ncbi:tetratricopeptide repeat protein [bacterium]|nr:MAG: tetratricopeptide repeat protein [bacterium]